jgi:hypothetical protein
MSFSGGPVTTSGTLTLGGTLEVASGGTGAGVASSARANLGAAASGANTDITSVTLTTGTITTAPTSSTDIVNKTYADSIASGVNFHAACQYGTTSALPANTYNNGSGGVNATLTAAAVGTLTIDGYTFVIGDVGKRILVKNEVTGANNGVYTLTQAGTALLPYILTRATDYDTSGAGTNEVDQGDLLLVIYGTVNNNTSWVQQTPLPITIGTTDIVFVQFAAVQTYTAGTGLTLATNQFSITNTGTAGTYGSASAVPVFVTNAQGQVTGVTNTNISIPSGQVTGLGTMSTQNANAVAVTGGTIDGTTVGGTTPAAGTFTTLIGGGGSANYEQITGGAAGKAVQFQSLGSDAAVSLAIQSKGTGAIDLAAGSSGVNISNGGTVTALTRTATGSGYTGFPSIAISAPTTAGVQATATSQLVAGNATVVSGGTGYTVADVLTVTTAGGSSAITFTVTTVSSGVITAVTTSSSALTTIPTGTLSVSGGTGSSATFTLNYVIAATFTITAAGSGYVEQPTVTFSGGGGSAAAAYATVGSQTIIKGLGISTGTITNQSIMFQTPSGNSLLLRDSGQATPDAHLMVQSTANGYALAFAEGSNANASLYVGAKGTGSIRFNTNGTSLVEQMRVSHTASAVNYVQVTGAVTGGAPTISAQGSDAAVGLQITSKGTLPLYLNTAGAIDVRIQPLGIRSFSFNSVTSAVNYGTWINAAAGSSPTLGVAGTDTNISMALQSKGTGAIDLASGSSGVNVSNGGTVTALTRTNGGSYATFPTIVISAPTTTGGVQATASVVAAFNQSATIANGGTGYTVGDTLTMVGGTPTSTAGAFTVSTVSAGVVTAVTAVSKAYSVLPTNPVSTTGGTGTGCTLTVFYAIDPGGLSVTNAGSGYVEQPTVTFSSGTAAAYATVGAGSIIRSLGSTGTQSLDFYTPAGISTGVPNFRIRDTTGDSYWQSSNQAQTAQLTATGNVNAIAMISANGGGNVTLRTGGGNQYEQLRASNTTSAVNYHNFVGSATTFAPVHSVAGSDTNISMVLQSKGTGAIDLVTGSSGVVNISNGGTVTAITRTAVGSAYTSPPTVAISAPTTAGGVQAAATAFLGNLVVTPAIVSGGTAGTYAVNDVLTLVGGTFVTASTLTVTAVSAGVITAVSVATGGQYSVIPTGTISTTGGGGTGATFTVSSWGVTTTFTIGTAGSGYVEQPTVTFSGGGGSGAAAYAAVGAMATIKGLYGGASAAPLQFSGPSGALLQLVESGATSAPVALVVKGGSTSTQQYPNLSNSSIQFSSNGTGIVQFYTNTLSAEQLRVTHTASAVNYVQVTGAATGAGPIISAQGSDASAELRLRSKNTFNIRLQNGAGNDGLVVDMTSGATLANYVSIAPKVTGTSPVISALGTDADIDLTLTPKGAGAVRFGTYTATVTAVAGYITIKDSGGTVRKLAVLT